MNLPAPHEWSPTTSSPALAGYGRRMLAWLVDLLIFVVPAFFVVAATVDLDSSDPVASIPFGVSIGFAVAFVLYQTAMVAWRGQTVGAISMSIKVVRIDSREHPGWQPSAIRALVPQVAGVVPYLGPLLVVVIHGWMFFDPRRQGLQDKAAGTIVVSATA
jgi:uncharacterized RDD family membrane protein YckC